MTDLIRPQAPSPGPLSSLKQRLSLWRQERVLRSELDTDITTARGSKLHFALSVLGASMVVFSILWAIQLWRKQPPVPIDDLIPVLDSETLTVDHVARQTAATSTDIGSADIAAGVLDAGTGGSTSTTAAAIETTGNNSVGASMFSSSSDSGVSNTVDGSGTVNTNGPTQPVNVDCSTGLVGGIHAGSSGVAGAADTIRVHVLGAVERGGVVELPQPARVFDAVEAAGGPNVTADIERVNLAAHIVDGDWVWVPPKGVSDPPDIVSVRSEGASERTGAYSATGTSGLVSAGVAGVNGSTGGAASSGAVEVIDINSATAAELETLSGVGPATASAIIETRNRRGPFINVDELVEVPGIGPGRLERLRPHIVAIVTR